CFGHDGYEVCQRQGNRRAARVIRHVYSRLYLVPLNNRARLVMQSGPIFLSRYKPWPAQVDVPVFQTPSSASVNAKAAIISAINPSSTRQAFGLANKGASIREP